MKMLLAEAGLVLSTGMLYSSTAWTANLGIGGAEDLTAHLQFLGFKLFHEFPKVVRVIFAGLVSPNKLNSLAFVLHVHQDVLEDTFGS